jgi:hypothetical protein
MSNNLPDELNELNELNENDSTFDDESEMEKPSKKRPEIRRRIEEVLEARRLRDELDFEL